MFEEKLSKVITKIMKDHINFWSTVNIKQIWLLYILCYGTLIVVFPFQFLYYFIFGC